MSATSDIDGNENAVDMRVVGKLATEDMTRAQCRLRISKALGFNKNNETPFGKNHLRSMFWAITGNPPCPKKIIGTDKSPHIGALRAKIANAVGFDYEYNYTDAEGNYIPRERRNEAPFKLDELQAIVDVVTQQSDKRPKPGRE